MPIHKPGHQFAKSRYRECRIRITPQCTGRMHSRSTKHQNRSPNCTQDEAKADRFPPPIGANPSPHRTSTEKRKQEGKTRCARRRGIQSSPPMAPDSTTSTQRLSMPQKPKPNRERRSKRGGESSLFSGVKQEERRILP